MNRQPFEKPPRWWAPRLSPLWVTLLRPLRRREQRKRHRLVKVEVRGAKKVRSLLDSNYGVLITPNHCSHADCFTLYEAADRIGSPLYAMMAWQVFGRGNWLRRQLLRVHGAFSVDREGADLSALRQARHVLQNEPFPLAVFPEGEVYHLNDRVTPFREGPAAMAIMAARKANRPIACVPCAMRYSYVEDPTPELLPLLDRLEEAMHWRPRPHESMQGRIYKLAEGMLALKELEVFGKTQSGLIPERVNRLIQLLLGRIETKYGLCGDGRSVPERVKTARQTLIALMHQGVGDEASRLATTDELDDLFLVVQAFSYPGDYVRESPTIERMAETLDKFEEDLLGAKTASIRGARRAVVSFGDPVILQAGNSYHASAEELTSLLQDSVEQLLGTPRRQSQTA